MDRACSTASGDRHVLEVTAHELRNMLSPLASAIDLLATGDPERRAWALEIARHQLSCMRQLVSDMAEAGSWTTDAPQQVSRAPLVLQELLEECLATSASMFMARGQHLTSMLDPQPLWIHGDPGRLTQIVSNLLTNASKYTDCGGHISITCRRIAQSAEFAVADDGAGIMPENLARIFEPLYREERVKRIAPGLGVGLGVASALVRAHGGSVWSESDGPGTGSRFVVRLPLLTVEVGPHPVAPERRADDQASRACRP